jgi:uncharacterized protein (DUF1330 family)
MTRQIGLLGALLGSFACGVAAVHAVQAQARPPAYTIAEIEVTDPATFQKYGEATRTSIPAAGGRVIVRGGKTFIVNGAAPKQVVVIQWESFERAQAFFESEGYKQLIQPDEVLALNAIRTPWLVLRPVIDAFRQRYGAATRCIGFKAVWVVGWSEAMTEQLDT